jgi:hypothetical protein
MSTKESYSLLNPENQTEKDLNFSHAMSEYFINGMGTYMDKLRNFTKYVPRQILTAFLVKNSIYQHVLNIHGHIIECGVFLGAGLMTWAQLSAIYEPINHTRRIVGFDTFEGFSAISQKDRSDQQLNFMRTGGLSANSYEDLKQCIQIYDQNRPIGHIPRVELQAGDAVKTIPEYVQNNQHLVVAMLYLDFDVYEPTKVALETFVPRMPKGAVIAFDELNQAAWPGETLAVMETVGLRNLRIQRYPYAPALSFAILE